MITMTPKVRQRAMRSFLASLLQSDLTGAEMRDLADELARGEGYYLDKKDILQFHKEHTLNFVELQKKLGVVARMETWYGRISSVVHGQIPGAWIEHKSLAETKPIKATQDLAIGYFTEGEDIVHRFFLCTVGRQLWDSFSSQAKKQLLAGMHGDDKKALQLDAA